MSPKWRVRAAWVLLVACLLGWPISMVTFAKDEPPAILALSWLAVAITALDVVSTQTVREKQEDKDGDG
jgi:hypothetical protein